MGTRSYLQRKRMVGPILILILSTGFLDLLYQCCLQCRINILHFAIFFGFDFFRSLWTVNSSSIKQWPHPSDGLSGSCFVKLMLISFVLPAFCTGTQCPRLLIGIQSHRYHASVIPVFHTSMIGIKRLNSLRANMLQNQNTKFIKLHQMHGTEKLKSISICVCKCK